jgi:hypothetical protein
MTTPAAPSQIYMTLDKHLTTLMNCLPNVVYGMMLFHFINTFVSWVGFIVKNVSPLESWKGFFYNIWFSMLVFSTMMAFRSTLECLILFENAERNRDGKKDATTIISVNKNSMNMKHVDNGVPSSAWHAIAGYIINKFSNKDETTEDASTQKEGENAKDASTQNEDDAKSATTPVSNTDDEIKQDAASASSSARSSADTADVLN